MAFDIRSRPYITWTCDQGLTGRPRVSHDSHVADGAGLAQAEHGAQRPSGRDHDARVLLQRSKILRAVEVKPDNGASSSRVVSPTKSSPLKGKTHLHHLVFCSVVRSPSLYLVQNASTTVFEYCTLKIRFSQLRFGGN